MDSEEEIPGLSFEDTDFAVNGNDLTIAFGDAGAARPLIEGANKSTSITAILDAASASCISLALTAAIR